VGESGTDSPEHAHPDTTTVGDGAGETERECFLDAMFR